MPPVNPLKSFSLHPMALFPMLQVLARDCLALWGHSLRSAQTLAPEETDQQSGEHLADQLSNQLAKPTGDRLLHCKHI